MFKRLSDADLLRISGLMLVALAILVGLGTWQWRRKAWKEDLVATISARLRAAPADNSAFKTMACPPVEQAGLAASCEYMPVSLTGSFDHANERHVYAGIEKPAGGVGGQGYWIMTPLRLEPSTDTIAVSRGFVPDTGMSETALAGMRPAGVITIAGLVRGAELRTTFINANDPAKNTWYLRSPAELFAGLTPKLTWPGFFVDLQSPVPPGGLPQPTAGRLDIPNRHLEYALTWWGLAVTLLAVYVAFAADRLRAAKPP